jgi:hypothetical protein
LVQILLLTERGIDGDGLTDRPPVYVPALMRLRSRAKRGIQEANKAGDLVHVPKVSTQGLAARYALAAKRAGDRTVERNLCTRLRPKLRIERELN